MKRVIMLIGVLLMICAPSFSQSAFIPVISTKLTDTSGNLISNAKACGRLTLSNASPASVQVNGGGQTTQPPVCSTVTNGNFTLNLPNTAVSNPANACVAITVTDNISGRTLIGQGYGCVQPTSVANNWCNGSSCNFDLYVPNFPAQALVQSGPAGPQGTPGCVVGSGACNTVVSTTPSASQTVIQPANTMLNVQGTVTNNNKSVCVGDGTGCPSYSSGTNIGMSADGTTAADDGGDDRFFADMHPVGTNADGSMMAPGWDTQQNVYMAGGRWTCKTCTSPGVMVRQIQTQALQNPAMFTFAAQATLYGSGGSSTNNCFWFTNAANGAVSTSNNQRIGTCITNAGWIAIANGTTYPIVSGAFGLGLSSYDISFWYYNGVMQLSAVASGPNDRSILAAPFTVPVSVTPPSGLLNLEATVSSATDEQSNLRYSIGNSFVNMLNMPYDSTHVGLSAVANFATAGGTLVAIPKSYKVGMANRWVLYFHGYAESANGVTGTGNSGIGAVTQELVQAGYVVVGINNTYQNCYGSPQCNTDIAAVVAQLHNFFSLAPQPYVMAESMGTLQMANAVSQGIIAPRAMVGMCSAFNMAYIYSPTGQNAGGAVNPPYGITSQAQFLAVYPTYDPIVASASQGMPLARLASVPTMLWASYGDHTVNRALNTDLYASQINTAGGNVTVISSSGDHEDISNFNGPAVVAFFNAH